MIESKSAKTPSYRHHKPSGQAVVTLEGRDCYLGDFGSPESREEYDRIVAEWLVHGRSLGRAAENKGKSISEIIAAYWRFASWTPIGG
jgi:hypothetical protein